MISSYVLIAFLTLNHWEAGGLAMQEFESRGTCEFAKQSIKSSMNASTRIKLLICVPK